VGTIELALVLLLLTALGGALVRAWPWTRRPAVRGDVTVAAVAAAAVALAAASSAAAGMFMPGTVAGACSPWIAAACMLGSNAVARLCAMEPVA